jgi:hypothetical protein
MCILISLLISTPNFWTVICRRDKTSRVTPWAVSSLKIHLNRAHLFTFELLPWQLALRILPRQQEFQDAYPNPLSEPFYE